MSTAAMICEATRRHRGAFVAAIDCISLSPDGSIVFDAQRVQAKEARTPETLVRALAGKPTTEVRVGDIDAVVIRTNPGRDKARASLHDASLNLCRLAASQGAVVLNDPDALPKTSDKLFLAQLPESTRPRMLVSRNPARLREFVEDAKGESVLKPLFGTQGRGVFRVRGGGHNLAALIEVLTADGFVIAQEYLRRAHEGDIRLIVLDGKPLTVDGRLCAVRRVPTRGEFRSNIHLGGTAMIAETGRGVRAAATAIGQTLAEHGIWMAGVDLVGTRAVEINVRSPGGLVDASAFEGVDFTAAALDSLEARVALAP